MIEPVCTDAREQIIVPRRIVSCAGHYVELGGAAGMLGLYEKAGGRNILKAFGVEMGNRYGFLTLEHRGLNAQILEGAIEADSRGYRRRWTHTIGPHPFEAEEELRVEDAEIRRLLRITPLDDAPIFDAVLRWGLCTHFVDRVLLGGKEFTHRRQNLYRQFAVGEMTVRFREGEAHLCVRPQAADPAGMEQHLYARDSAEGWILHHRLFTTAPRHYYLRACCRWLSGTVSTPAWLWQRFGRTRDLFYLIRERRVPRFPFQLMGEVEVERSQLLQLEHVLRFSV